MLIFSEAHRFYRSQNSELLFLIVKPNPDDPIITCPG
jgi:hypothetical protein